MSFFKKTLNSLLKTSDKFKNILLPFSNRTKLSQNNIDQLEEYLSKISDKALYSYNVYQIEGEGRNLFSKIDGDEDTIMGLPIKKIKEYLKDQI